MPYANVLIDNLGPLAAYGEYSEESYSYRETKPGKSSRKPFVPQNHLGGEVSPYLLKHAQDPVGWFSWGNEAFQTALAEDRPVFLSIGYSSNHWCSVMGRDCWADLEAAGMVNDVCIPVLVDREEYPDVDAVMMEICRVQNGSAGYPLNIFMTPDARPFMCVTWLPKRTMGQMVGITEIMPRIRWLWTVQRDDVERAANDLAEMVRERLDSISGRKSSGRIGKFTAYEALNDTRSVFDIRWGGFGMGQKFPEPDKLTFLLNQSSPESGASKHDVSDSITMTDITLRRMWRGGIHDHLGGGFFVSSNDSQWLVPHFEKLLPVNASILLCASLSQRIHPTPFCRLLAEDVIFCLTRYFADGESFSQGFRAAIDGDTAAGEGRYYLWNEGEIKALLPDDAGLFCAAYAVLPSGNFGSELAGSQMSWNILYEASTVTELARRYGMKGAEVASRLYEARKTLLDYRDKRYPLIADSKILMNWNGLAIGALAHASVSFEVKEWLDMAERVALFITRNFADKNGSWSRVWTNGGKNARIPATADDIACFLWGVLELYKASVHFGAGEKQLGEWRETLRKLADYLIETFGDDKNGGLFMTADKVAGIRLKSPEDYNSLPSANAIAAIVLDELSFILEDRKYADFSRGIIGCFARYVKDNPLRCLTMITADLLWKPYKPKKKPVPEEKPVLTDDELNRDETEAVQEEKSPAEDRKSSRASRRSQRQETTTAGRNERTSRRGARPHRTRER